MAQLILNTYQIQDCFSDLAEEIRKDLSKKEKRAVNKEEVSYFIEYSVRLQSIRGSDLGRMLMARREPKEPQFPADSYVFSELTGKLGRKQSRASLSAAQKEIVINILRYQWEERQAAEAIERARFNALTPEQQRAEMEANLAELRKDPGFMEIKITDKDEE